MKKVTAFIETGDDGTFNVYVNGDLPFGLIGEGKTVEEAVEDFKETYNEMKELYEEETGKSIDYGFEFKYDLESFFNRYSKVFSMPSLEKLTGINQKQLHHYAGGYRKPRKAQKQKIENALHSLGKELQAVRL